MKGHHMNRQESGRRIQPATPRKSGLTHLNLALMGKGAARRLSRPMTPAETNAYLARQAAEVRG